jgi:hypothetical protein
MGNSAGPGSTELLLLQWPEIPPGGPGAEPIVGVFTDGDVRFARENAFCHFLIASMKTQHPSGRTHDLPITFPNFITLGDESMLEQEGTRGFGSAEDFPEKLPHLFLLTADFCLRAQRNVGAWFKLWHAA